MLPPSPNDQSAQGYDPKRSRVSDDSLMDFIRAQVQGDITEVPGIGPAAAKKLADGEHDECITNTYQLIGKVSCLGFVVCDTGLICYSSN